MNEQKNIQYIQTTRDGFGLGLVQAAQLDPRVVGVCADLTESVRMQWFRDQFPDRFFEVGVAEQNLVGVAAGLALGGLIPFAASYACFSPANSWGVIRTSVCYNNVPGKIIGGHAGLVTGEDGATHQSLEDIATMRVLPNMTVVVPCDGEEARKATVALAAFDGSAYLRTSKYKVGALTNQDSPFTIGVANVLKEGEDVSIIGCGTILEIALAAARELEEKGVSVRVVNMHTIKPLDVDRVRAAARETKHIFTLEDHQIIGGLGSAVAEVLASLPSHAPLTRLGIDDRFGESGSAHDLLEAYRLTPSHLVTAIQSALVTKS